MIGNIVTNDQGIPLDGNGKMLSVSSYNPPDAVRTLLAQVMRDYQTAWTLQNRPFDEFDGYSLLDRARLDQQTFGAYVGADFVPEHKRWRWRGRKNTARNLVIGILAHVIAGMLFPVCEAYNDEDEEDKMTAKVMRILVENHLRRANYELKFLFMMTSALVNPAVFVEVEYIEALQRVKMKNADGSYRVEEVVDELLSGLNLNIIPIDSLLLGDFYTFDLQRQPFIFKVRRISYDEARSIYQGKCIIDGVDQFKFVEAGKTRVVMSGNDNQTLYDVDWTEADGNFVQEVTAYYRGEDLEVTILGGVFMGQMHKGEVYNCNPFKHRRLMKIKNKWISIPIYPFAKSGFEPLDPSGRFAYYKSACFKEFWDDASQNRAYQLAQDGMSLDVIKPMFLSGVSKFDGTVMRPGATIAMPQGATATPYQLGANITAALEIMRQNVNDLSLSTQDVQQSGQATPGVTATASIKAEQNAKVMLSVFGAMTADLVRQVGELTIDCINMNVTVGDVEDQLSDEITMKYKTFIGKGKENGKNVTEKIEFDASMVGYDMTPEEADEKEWDLFNKLGGVDATVRSYKVNPYKFARHRFSMYVDPEMIVSKSMGTDQIRKDRAFNILTDPRVAPFVNQQAVVDKYVLEEYSDGNPDAFKKEANPNELINAAMGQQPMPQMQGAAQMPAMPEGTI